MFWNPCNSIRILANLTLRSVQTINAYGRNKYSYTFKKVRAGCQRYSKISFPDKTPKKQTTWSWWSRLDYFCALPSGTLVILIKLLCAGLTTASKKLFEIIHSPRRQRPQKFIFVKITSSRIRKISENAVRSISYTMSYDLPILHVI